MRCCFVFHHLGTTKIANIETLEAPPIAELQDPCLRRTRVFQRLTGTTDPVNGIVVYEEVER